jgi:hypothetical protein
VLNVLFDSSRVSYNMVLFGLVYLIGPVILYDLLISPTLLNHSHFYIAIESVVVKNFQNKMSESECYLNSKS